METSVFAARANSAIVIDDAAQVMVDFPKTEIAAKITHR